MALEYTGSRSSVAMDKEPDLPEVASDDKTLIRNIIYTAMALNRSDHFCSGWQVQCVPRGYMVIFFLNPSFAISIHDINMIRELNSCRICNIVVLSNQPLGDGKQPAGPNKPVLRVHVLDCKQPVMHYDADIVRVRKRARAGASALL